MSAVGGGRRVGGSGGSKLSRSLLGSDAAVEANARKLKKGVTVVKKKDKVPPGLLLNCTTESRRRAQEGNVESRRLNEDFEEGEELKHFSQRILCWSLFVGIASIGIQRKREAFSSSLTGLALIAWLLVAWQIRVRRSDTISKKKRQSIARMKGTVGNQARNRKGPEVLAACFETSERRPPLPLLELPENDINEAWMKEAGIAHRWTAAERRFLDRAKSKYQNELMAPSIKYLDAYGDRRLLRFLRQDPTQDEDRALTKLGDYLAWRAKANIDETTRPRIPQYGHDPSKWPHGDVLLECIRLLQCSDTYFNKNGFAVTVYQAFHWPASDLRRHVGSMTTKQLVDFATFGAEFNAVQMDRIAISRERFMLDHAKRLWLAHKDKRPLSASFITTRTTEPVTDTVNDYSHTTQEPSTPQTANKFTIQSPSRTPPPPRRCESGSTLAERDRLAAASSLIEKSGAHNTNSIKMRSAPTTPASPKSRQKKTQNNQDEIEPWHRNETPLIYDGWGELTRLCAITDMAGCTFGSMAMPQLIPAVIQSVSLFVNNYPYIVGELHVINCAPFVARVFKRALNAVVPKHIADQVQIHVRHTELLRSIRPSHLPKQVGGDAECPALDPPPPPSASQSQKRNNRQTENREQKVSDSNDDAVGSKIQANMTGNTISFNSSPLPSATGAEPPLHASSLAASTPRSPIRSKGEENKNGLSPLASAADPCRSHASPGRAPVQASPVFGVVNE